MLTALPLAGPAGASDLDRSPTFDQVSYHRADPTPGRLEGFDQGPSRGSDHGPQNAAQQHRQAGQNGASLIGPTSTVNYSSLFVTPLPGFQYHLVWLSTAPSSGAFETAQTSTLDRAPSPSFDATLVTPLEVSIDSSVPTDLSPTPTPTLTFGTPSARRSPLLPEGEGTSASAMDSIVGTTNSLVVGGPAFLSAEVGPSLSSKVTPDPAESEIRLDDAAQSDMPSPVVTGGAFDVATSDRMYAFSVFELTSVVTIDAIAEAYVESTGGTWGETPTWDLAFAADAWDDATQPRRDFEAELGLADDERLADVAGLWIEKTDLEFDSYKNNDDDDSDQDDDTVPSIADPGLRERHDLMEFPDRFLILEAIDRKESPPASDATDCESAASDNGGDQGMIQIAYRDPAATQQPSQENTSTDGDAPGVSGIDSVELIKTDGSCARYQSFEIAQPPPQPVPQNGNVAADAGNGVSPGKEKPPSKDASA